MRKKNSGLTVAGIVVVVISIGLGIFFDFTKGSTCWHCWKSDNLTIPGRQFVFLSSPENVFHCQKCALIWPIGEPWNTLSLNPPIDPRRKVVEVIDPYKAIEPPKGQQVKASSFTYCGMGAIEAMKKSKLQNSAPGRVKTPAPIPTDSYEDAPRNF